MINSAAKRAAALVGEPSLADMLAAIEKASDLDDSKRLHWRSSVRFMVKALGLPASALPARLSGLRHRVADLNAAAIGCGHKTLQNHRSNLIAALKWFCEEESGLARGAVKTPAWQALWDLLPSRKHYGRTRLSGLMRYCSAQGIEPCDVNDEVVKSFMAYRGEHTRLAANDQARRLVAKAWNDAGRGYSSNWPQIVLFEPPPGKSVDTVQWEAFPEGLRDDVAAYLARLSKPRTTGTGRRWRANKPSSIKTRQEELRAVARKAVQAGASIDELTSLRKLVHPDLVETVLKAYWPDEGETPDLFVIDLGWKLLSLAKELGGFTADEIAKLEEFRSVLEDHRSADLSEKNKAFIRTLLGTDVWGKVVSLPQVLLQEAAAISGHASKKAALLAQSAVAISILSVAPIRRNNLVSLKIGESLIQPGGPGTPYWITIPRYDVKNRVALEYPLRDFVSEVIDTYLKDYRDRFIAPGLTSVALFPGGAGSFKGEKAFADQVCDTIKRKVGLTMTLHQFRHAAGAIFLQAHPGEYETVRQLLGHKNVQTTVKFYTGLNPLQATRRFGELIADRIAAE
jgi:integrase